MIVCQLCGKKLHQITNTHLKKCSNTSLKSYRKKFPSYEVVSEEFRLKNSIVHTGIKQTKEHVEKRIESMSDYKHSIKTKHKISRSNIGKSRNKGRKFSESHKRKLSIVKSELWSDPVYKKKHVKAVLKGNSNSPNKTEQILQNLLDKIDSKNWEFTGDGSIIVDGKCPDFINKKMNLIVELFGDYWHSEELTNQKKEDHEKDRINHFKKSGYDTLIIWEHELKNENLVKQKIINFQLV